MKKIFTLMAIAAFAAACIGNANKPAEVVEEEIVVVEECTCPEGECTCAEGECTCQEAPATEEVAAPAETPAE